MKTCSKCKIDKSLSDFYNDKQKADGKTSKCRDCMREVDSKYRSEHKEQAKERYQRYYPEHKDKYRTRMKVWSIDNKDKLYSYKKKWMDKNPGKSVEYNNRYRARVVENGGRITSEEWEDLLNFFGRGCLKCGSQEKITLDHIIPISKGGRNSIENAQPLCKSCNSSKGSKIIDYRGELK